MRIGINGLGRIGRLALRAAWAAYSATDDDPRGDDRLDIVHVNELQGRGGHCRTPPGVRQHPRSLAGEIGPEADDALLMADRRIGFTAPPRRARCLG